MPYGKRWCHDESKHWDIKGDVQEKFSKSGCNDNDKMMKPGDDAIEWAPTAPGSAGRFKVSWVDGCEEVSEQSVMFPLEEDDSVTCDILMRDNYNHCEYNNHTSSSSPWYTCVECRIPDC